MAVITGLWPELKSNPGLYTWLNNGSGLRWVDLNLYGP